MHHVSVNVTDVDAAIQFYTDVLGLTVRSDRPDLRVGGAWLDAGDQQVHLIEGEAPPGLGQHFAVRVANLGDAVEELRGRGVKVSDPTPIGRSLQAFLHDPAGNMIEIHEAR